MDAIADELRNNPLHNCYDDQIAFRQLQKVRIRYIASLVARRAEMKARPEVLWQERHNLLIERHLTPPTPERQQRIQDVMTEVTVLWTQLSANEASLKKFVRAKRLRSFE